MSNDNNNDRPRYTITYSTPDLSAYTFTPNGVIINASPATPSTSTSTSTSGKSNKKRTPPKTKKAKKPLTPKKPKLVLEVGSLVQIKKDHPRATMLRIGDYAYVKTLISSTLIEIVTIRAYLVGSNITYTINKSHCIKIDPSSVEGFNKNYKTPDVATLNKINDKLVHQEQEKVNDEKFKNIDPKIKTHFIQLCSNYGLDANNLTVDDVKKYLVGTSIREVTRNFIAVMEKETVQIPESFKTVLTENQKNLLKNSNVVLKTSSAVKSIEKYIEEKKRQADTYLEVAQRELAQAAREAAKIDHLFNGVQTFIDELDIIQKDKFFTFSPEHSNIPDNVDTFRDIDHYELGFITKPVIINYTVLGERKQFNLGQYLIKYVSYNNEIKVYAFKNNTIIGGKGIHPHVNADGYICWGNASAEFSSAMTLKKFSIAFNLLKSLLHTFGGTPYYGMHQFEYAKRNSTLITYEEGKLVSTGFINSVPRSSVPSVILDSGALVMTLNNSDYWYEIMKHTETDERYIILNSVSRIAIKVENWFTENLIKGTIKL